MSLFQAVVLGLVQGLTEFLPVSSSAHLVIIPEVFGWEGHSLVFDTTLHLGTSLAVLIYFWNDLVLILKNIRDWWLKLFLGVLPAGLLGFFLTDFFEGYFRSTKYVILFLILGSVLMWLAERLSVEKVKEEEIEEHIIKRISSLKSLRIGLFQALALFPGFSRSGSTISGGMLSGLSRKKSARFSFLLSIPLVWAAGFYEFTKVSFLAVSEDWIVPLIVGFLVSFLVGFFCIKLFMKFIAKSTLKPFIFYRIFLAVVLMLFLFVV